MKRFFIIMMLLGAYASKAADLSFRDGVFAAIRFHHERGHAGHMMSGIATNLTNFSAHASSSFSLGGSGGGVALGYGKVKNSFYGGLEISIDLSGTGGQQNFSFLNGINSWTSLSARKDFMATLAARAGVLLNSSTLAYVKGGILTSQYRFSLSIASDANGVAVCDRLTRRLPHFVIGAGLERTIELPPHMPEMRLGAEVDHILSRNVQIPANSASFQGAGTVSPEGTVASVRLVFPM